MAIETTTMGSAGHIIAAALETSGQYLQSQFLDVMESGLAQSFGTLLYLLAAISAIFIYVIGGKYKFGLWFFIGPPLFFQCVFVRMDSDGTAWQWGSTVHPQEKVYIAAAGVGSDTTADGHASAKEMKISWFFAQWNYFTSGVVQTTVDLLQGEEKYSQLHFMKQVGRYTDLFRADINDPALKKFVSLMTVGECADYYAQIAANFNFARNDTFDRRDIKAAMQSSAQKIVFNFNSNPDLVSWLQTAGIKDLAAKALPNKFNSDGTIKINQALTCFDTWKLSVAIAKNEAAGLIERLAAEGTENEEERAEAKKRLYAKFATQTNNQDGTVKLLDNYSDDEKAVLLMNEVAVRYIIRELRAINPEVAQLNYLPTRLTKTEAGREVDSDIAKSIRFITQYDQYQGKGDFLAAAQSLPYMQGFVLFFLAACYPFFAFALLIPGRHHAMLLWMGLWFWAKSWDIGFALVMIIDNILYSFMPHGPAISSEIADDPLTALKTAMEVDPTYSEATYYNLIAACTLAIPAIMGLFLKTGGKEIFGAVDQGIRDFSGAIGKSVSRFMQSVKSHELFRDVDRDINQNGFRSNLLNAIMQQDVVNELGSKALYQLAAQYGGQESKLNAAAQSALIKTAAKEITTVFAGMNKAEASRKKDIVSSLISLHINQAGVGESIRQENVDRAKRAVSLNYGSHDSIMAWPDEVSVYQKKATYPLAETLSNTIAGVASGVSRRLELENLMGEDGSYDPEEIIRYVLESDSRSIDSSSFTPGARRP